MRKTITVLCILALICTLTAGAAFVLSSVTAGNGALGSLVRRKGVDKSITHTFSSGEMKELDYDKSRIVETGFADIYHDENDNDYIFKNGNLTGFYSNEIEKSAADCTPIGKDAARKIAIEYLSEYTENTGEYALKSFYEKSNYGQYYFTFARKIGEIFTTESADVWVMYDGTVHSVALRNYDELDELPEGVVEGITVEELEAFAKIEMKIIYPNSRSKFEMDSHFLTKDDRGYYIAIGGTFGNGYESVRYYLEY